MIRMIKGTGKPIVFEETSSGCHECISHKGIKNYPVIVRNGKNFYMSRYLWQQKFGKIPKGLCILHKCDNPKCININHFFLGTRIENTLDRTLKGRSASGIRNGRAKLSESDVKKIITSQENQYILANKYGLRQCTISSIQRGVLWKNVWRMIHDEQKRF